MLINLSGSHVKVIEFAVYTLLMESQLNITHIQHYNLVMRLLTVSTRRKMNYHAYTPKR